MKTIAVILAALSLTACASVPNHCVRNGALYGGLAATAGYVVADNSGKKHHYSIVVPSQIPGEDDHELISYYKTGKLYENRGMIAATTGLTTGAITTAVCAVRSR